LVIVLSTSLYSAYLFKQVSVLQIIKAFSHKHIFVYQMLSKIKKRQNFIQKGRSCLKGHCFRTWASERFFPWGTNGVFSGRAILPTTKVREKHFSSKTFILK